MEMVIKILLAIFVPPLAVALHRKPCLVEVVVNCVLWVLCVHIGALLHALFVVFAEEDTRGWKLES